MADDPLPPVFVHSTFTVARSCPVCRTVLDGATSASVDPDDPTPTLEPGAVTCCASCGALLVVTAAGFRLATDDDLAEIDPALRALLYEFAAQRTKGGAQ